MVKTVAMIMLKNKDFLTAFLIAAALTATGAIIKYIVDGNNIPELPQIALISLTTTMYAYIVSLILKAAYNYKKYIALAGKYIGYAYKNENDKRHQDFYAIKDKSQSVAILEYVSESDFRIRVSVTDPPEINELVWNGDFKMISSNMATIGWWYTNDHLKYAIGLKRAVINGDAFVLFSDDKSVHGREVFIKDRSYS